MVRDIFISLQLIDKFSDRCCESTWRRIIKAVPGCGACVGYFTRVRLNTHDYRLDIQIVVAEAVAQNIP
jgi:hypothetical protein